MYSYEDLSLAEKVEMLYIFIFERIYSWYYTNKAYRYFKVNKGLIEVDYLTGFHHDCIPLESKTISICLDIYNVPTVEYVGAFVDFFCEKKFFELISIVNPDEIIDGILTRVSVAFKGRVLESVYYKYKFNSTLPIFRIAPSLKSLISVFTNSFPNYKKWDLVYPETPNPFACLLYRHFYGYL